MNVKDLRAALEHLPDDLMVVVRGYEGGVNEVAALDQYRVKLDANDEWYYGQHEQAADGQTPVVEIVGDHTA